MNRRQFLILFLCTLIPWWVGSGLMSLLPLYAASLGASPTVVGNYLSFIFLALATGTVAGGWIASRLRHYRQLLMALAAIAALAILLSGYVTVIWQLVLLHVTTWLAAGISVSMVMIMVGEQSEEHKRGHAFGLLATAAALGGVLGGVTGFIVDAWGYRWLFALSGATWLVQVVVASFLHNPSAHSRQSARVQADQEERAVASPPFAMTFVLVTAIALLASVANFAGFLGRTLAMEANSFPNATITLIAALGSALGLVANPLLGRLSDRGGRRWLLGLLYIAGAFALVITAYARTVPHFGIVAALGAIGAAERGISVALVSDVVPRRALGSSLSIFDGVKWFGGVIGLSMTGYAIEQMGLTQTILLSALLPVLAASLLLFMPVARAHQGQTPAPQLDPL